MPFEDGRERQLADRLLDLRVVRVGFGIEAGNEELRREIEQKQMRIQRLENDPQEQEIEIRQRLKLAAPGEKIYIIDDRKK